MYFIVFNILLQTRVSVAETFGSMILKQKKPPQQMGVG